MIHPPQLTLTGLHVYPVKSCRGIQLTEAELTTRGLEWDREWMLVDSGGRFVTQREEPTMALVSTELSRDALVLRAPGLGSLVIPLTLRPMPIRSVQVWKHSLMAWDEGWESAAWFSKFLGRQVHLVRFPSDARRLSNFEWTGGVEAENRFSDAYPILLISEESLADLNRRVGGTPLLMDRFRTNLVVAGGEPYVEDRIGRLLAPGIELRVIKPCTRCSITATNQQTAEVSVEPLKTLAGYRKSERPSGVVFGQNVMLISGVGQRVKLGMPWTVELKSENQLPPQQHQR